MHMHCKTWASLHDHQIANIQHTLSLVAKLTGHVVTQAQKLQGNDLTVACSRDNFWKANSGFMDAIEGKIAY